MQAQIYLAIIVASTLFHAAALAAEVAFPQQMNDIQIFAAPDESSPLVASVKKGEVLSPVAETLGTGGAKWYLVQTKSGSVGWVNDVDSEQAKKLESFFKSLPNESPLIGPVKLPRSPSGSLPAGTIFVPVETNRSSVIVSVTLNDSLRATLLLDTGASRTMVSRRIANELALRSVGYWTGNTITGPVTRPIARLQSLRVGDAEVKDLVVSVHDLRFGPRVEGLLGLDFLNYFQVSLDARRRLLVLAPR